MTEESTSKEAAAAESDRDMSQAEAASVTADSEDAEESGTTASAGAATKAEAAPVTADSRDAEESGTTASVTADSQDEDQASIRELLRDALPSDEKPPADMLQGVQRKLRQRSEGKFYGDGWSTAKQPPIGTYLVTSLVMLAVVLAVWAVLAPLSGDPVEVDAPLPVNVLPPP